MKTMKATKSKMKTRYGNNAPSTLEGLENLTATSSVVRSLVMSDPMTVDGPFVVYLVPLLSFPVMTPEEVLMTAVLTLWWLASRNSVEYERVLTVLLLKSDGMIKMPMTKIRAPTMRTRRRASGAMGFSPPGMYFL